MKYSNLIADLIEEGATPVMILAAVRAIERQQDDALERRRESDRNRQQKVRAGHVTSRDTLTDHVSHEPSRPHVRVEDKTSNLEKQQKQESKKAARGTRLPDDFAPDIGFAISEGMSEARARTEAASFCDFWRAKPGGMKLDWQATWRVWARRSASEAPRPIARGSPQRPPSQADVFKFIGESAANGRQDDKDRDGVRQAVSYLPAVGSG